MPNQAPPKPSVPTRVSCKVELYAFPSAETLWGRSEPALRVCDFFDVVKNRGCKQNSYDDKLVINSKKSQTLGAVEGTVPAELCSARLTRQPGRPPSDKLFRKKSKESEEI